MRNMTFGEAFDMVKEKVYKASVYERIMEYLSGFISDSEEGLGDMPLSAFPLAGEEFVPVKIVKEVLEEISNVASANRCEIHSISQTWKVKVVEENDEKKTAKKSSKSAPSKRRGKRNQ